MKVFNPTRSNTINILKQTIYALQIIIIAFAIPVISYIELSHKESKASNKTGKNTFEQVVIVK